MAVIQRIRERHGKLVAIIIGIALVAFILGMFITEGGVMGMGSKKNVIGKIDGSKVKYTTFQQKAVELEKGMQIRYMAMGADPSKMSDQIRQQAYNKTWEYYLHENLMYDQYEEIGIAFSDADFDEMAMISPDTMLLSIGYFYDNGQYNGNKAKDLRDNFSSKSIDEQLLWNDLEFDMKRKRLSQKYNQILFNGLFVNKLELGFYKEQLAPSVDIRYIKKNFDEIPDNKVSVNEKEIKAYYKENREKYYRDETRDIKYVSFYLIPSAEDTLAAKRKLFINDSTLVFEKFANSSEVHDFVGTKQSLSFMLNNFRKDQLPAAISEEAAFSGSTGALVDPYVEDGFYKVARLKKRISSPDSVQTNIIQVNLSGMIAEDVIANVKNISDSMYTAIRGGADFNETYNRFSARYGQQYGMNVFDSTWLVENPNMQEFDELFRSSVGQVSLIEIDTNIGANNIHYIQISQIIDKTKAVEKSQYEILYSEISPSAITIKVIGQQAKGLHDEYLKTRKFEESAAKFNQIAIPVTGIHPMTQMLIQNMPSTRDIIQWAFDDETEKGAISYPKLYGDQYIVPIVSDMDEQGYLAMEDVKDQIKKLLIRQKKARLITKEFGSALAGASTLEEVAGKMELEIRRQSNIRFNTDQVSGSRDYSLIAAAVNEPEGKLSKPVFDKSGVYVFTVDFRDPEANVFTDDDIRNALRMDYLQWIQDGYSLRKELLRLAEVEDFRFRLY
ncbi:MAG: SurA N-terminal domain-containing protein [Bacteroidales bacterium]|nr:SurA N-terminal domain-containing protein [Bacteroidales bacterium]